MSTTNIFAEILISGIQSLTWLCILTATCLDLSKFRDRFSDPTTVEILTSSVFALAISYFLGVLFDRLWDRILEKLFPGLKDSAKEQARERSSLQQDEFSRIRSEVYRSSSENAAAFIDFTRSRMRVARSSVFNIPLIAITSVCWILIRCDANRLRLTIFIVIIGALLSWLATYAHMRLRIVYYQNLLMIGRNPKDDIQNTT